MTHSVHDIAIEEGPALLAHAAKGGRVFMPSGPIEPTALAQAFAAKPECADGLTFVSLMIPGINTLDWAALHEGAHAEIFLPNPAVAETIKRGQTCVLPLHYSAAYRYLCETPFKAAVFHVGPPDQDGFCSMSLSADGGPAHVDRDVFKYGIVNQGLPLISGAPKVPIGMFDAVSYIDMPPMPVAAQPAGAGADMIAGHVAALVKDGATLQAGIGKLPSSIMAQLAGHHDLKIHSGLIGDWALPLMESGALSEQPSALTAGVILGSTHLHAALQGEERVNLQAIGYTHNHSVLANIDNLTTINAALEIDLFGQINCEYAGARTIGGIGGALDFLRGARASKGGKPIVMIGALGKDGASRIVPRLNAQTVSIARSDPPILVTEFGSADLAPLDTQARCKAIIELAAPQHRQSLSDAWRGRAI